MSIMPGTSPEINKENDLLIEENNLIPIVAHHWPQILQIRHTTALMRLGHLVGRDPMDEVEKAKRLEYVEAIEKLMEIDGVKPVFEEGHWPPKVQQND